MTERLIHRARAMLGVGLSPREAREELENSGVCPCLAYLAVKAADLADRNR